jgi:hypothetical protein
MRMIANLMRSGCDQDLALTMADAAYSHPRITDDIRNRILAAIQADEAFQNAKAKEFDGIGAFVKAGFVDDIAG